MYEALSSFDNEPCGRSTLVSKNITVCNRRTSIRLEPDMWNALKNISRREQCSIHNICTLVDIRKKPETTLTAAIRVFIMLYYRAASTEDGHRLAGHGNFEFMKARAGLTGNTSLFARRSGEMVQQKAL